MSAAKPFEPRLLVAALALTAASLLMPAAADASLAAHAYFVSGHVVATSANGATRVLEKGSVVDSGDTINTGPHALAQLRFIDGQNLSLQPQSTFRVDEYNYDGKTDGTEKGFFSLLKGGFRAITGLIGKVHRDSYKVKTTVATIGIRGTAYSVQLTDAGVFLVQRGRIVLINKAGTFEMDRSTGRVIVLSLNSDALTDSQIEQLIEEAQSAFAEFLQLDHSDIIADNRTENGYPVIVPLPPPPPPSVMPPSCNDLNCGLLTVMSFTDASGFAQPLTPYLYSNTTVQFDSNGALSSFSVSGGTNGDVGTATLADVGGDGVIGWGSVIQGTAHLPFTSGPPQTENFQGQGGAAYVVGIPTTDSDLLALAGMTATYNLFDSTSPNFSNNTGPVGLGAYQNATGTLTLNFYNAPTSANFGILNMNLNFANATYSIQQGAVGGTGPTFTSQSVTGGTTVFASAQGTNFSDCVDGCPVDIVGLIAGSKASRAGFVYSLSSDHLDQSEAPIAISGAVVGKQTSLTPSPQ